MKPTRYFFVLKPSYIILMFTYIWASELKVKVPKYGVYKGVYSLLFHKE